MPPVIARAMGDALFELDKEPIFPVCEFLKIRSEFL
jgi:hypothetical protein